LSYDGDQEGDTGMGFHGEDRIAGAKPPWLRRH
jgi:hypothetical protein